MGDGSFAPPPSPCPGFPLCSGSGRCARTRPQGGTTIDLAAGTELAGHRIETVVSRGGMGVVYLARHLRLGRRVALKVLVPELSKDELFRERFIRESQLAATLDHPNIIPIYDAGEARELLYISMRYVEGSDLSVWLRRD